MKSVFLVFGFILLISFNAHGLGPRDVLSNGNPVKWSSGAAHVDIENDTMAGTTDVSAFITEALDTWDDLTQADLSIERRTLPVAVDNTNVCSYLYDPTRCSSAPTNDDINPLIIDEDGDITNRFFSSSFGANARYRILGFATISVSNGTTGAAMKGGAVFNANCLTGNVAPGCVPFTGAGGFTTDDFTSFMVHELGHFLGLDHSQVNLTEAENDSTTDDNLINTMFPIFISGNGAEFKTLEDDDKTALAQLYPSASFTSSTWSIAGVLYNTDGTTGVQCGNIVARNAASARVNALAALSGDFAQEDTDNGTFRIVGLTPGATYTLDVERIGAGYTGASGYTPCRGSSSGEPSPPAFTSFTSTNSFTAAATETVFVSCTRTSTSGDCVQTTSLGGSGATGGTGGTEEPSASSSGCSLVP